jgi:hypothetical protein
MCLIIRSPQVVATITTNPIRIYPSRSYPGNRPPTDLSEWFADQGALRTGRIQANDSVAHENSFSI